VPVTDGHDLNRFIAFPYDLHRGDPLWVPQLRMDMRTLLSPKKNPFWQHAEAQFFVGRSNGQTVGRIGAIRNDLHNQIHQDRVGFYGFFECVTTRGSRTRCGRRRPGGCRPRVTTRCAGR